MAKKSDTLRIGEVSNGTLRTIDLAEAMVYALRSIRLSRHGRTIVSQARKSITEWNDTEDPTETQIDELSYLVNETLFNMMNSHVPPYCYYGSTEGDGACFGVWPDVRSVEECLQYKEIPDISNKDVPKGYSGYAADISDHGNMTLYSFTNGRKREIWAVV